MGAESRIPPSIMTLEGTLLDPCVMLVSFCGWFPYTHWLK